LRPLDVNRDDMADARCCISMASSAISVEILALTSETRFRVFFFSCRNWALFFELVEA